MLRFFHLIAYLAIGLILSFSSCTDKAELAAANDDEIPVRFIATICGEAICQITDERLQTLGEQDFEYNGRVYDGVFRTELPCTVPPSLAINAEEPEQIWVRISKTPLVDNSDCVRCMATFAKAPALFYYTRILR